ncbi:MAG: DUF349 domain-containing protein [Paludibacteraceae bacterium]|nr:DUF349 domain-containing protein [Paludibacteraceae bacterium]
MNPLDVNKDLEMVKSDDAEIINETPSTIESNKLAVPAVASDPISAPTDIQKESTVSDEVSDKQTSNVEEKPAMPDYNVFSKSGLIDALKVLIQNNPDHIKEEVEIIKQTFYKKTKADNEEQKKLFVENGGEEIDFVPEKDELEDALKNLLNEYKTLKAALIAQKEKDKENNLIQKQHILEQMKALVESNDDVSAHINEFRTLQQKWKSLGHVPAQVANDLWKQYNGYQEAFWDLIKINNELREYDFRKNLEAKTLICETAEKLAEETDVVVAFQILQKLHDDWRELGPVARELREEIWTRFKNASAVVNKKHQSYFEGIREIEEQNLALKTTLCDKIEAFDYSGFKTYKQWDEATQSILAWQEEWRTIGFAPRRANQKLFERYRSLCDNFFASKADFYKESKNQLNENLERKKSLCEQAEALKESIEWKDTTDKLIQLQREWKTIGPVIKKHSDEIWKRFITACDYFFEQKTKNNSGIRTIEAENLEKKKQLIEQIKGLEKSNDTGETVAKLRELMAEWNKIGHVPFKEKDKIYKEFRTAVDKQFETLNVDVTQRRLDNFKTNLKDITAKGENKLYREREKLVRAYEHLKNEIAVYENNIGFLSSSSKKGGGIIREMERKIEALKEESRLIEQKINLIDENMK